MVSQIIACLAQPSYLFCISGPRSVILPKTYNRQGLSRFSRGFVSRGLSTVNRREWRSASIFNWRSGEGLRYRNWMKLLPSTGSSNIRTLSLVGITGILAPLLEETLFRGFFMVSLTKWVSTPVANIISSAAFALAHFILHVKHKGAHVFFPKKRRHL